MKWALSAVATLALLVMGARAVRVGLAGDYLDPVSHISAQDEALYSHSAIRMAEQGGWLTPVFLDRYGLYKPPLLMWLAGFSARVLGVSTFALRLPVVLLSCLTVCLVFLWVGAERGLAAAAAAALLLLADRLWLVLGAMCLTDGLLVGAMAVAFYALYRDPGMRSPRTAVVFGAAVAAGVLAKSAAGALPAIALGLYWVAAPADARPGLRRMALGGAVAAAIAAPWFVYQALVHTRWFFAEHIGLELVAFGTRTPPQTSHEGQAGFYLARQWLLDPPLTLLALAAAPAWIAACRRREPAALLLAAWTVAVAGSVVFWRYRNLSYLLPLTPALAIAATAYGPLFGGGASRRRTAWAAAAVALVAGVKAANPAQPWGVSFAEGTTLEVADALSQYCRLGRGNDLIQLGMDDALYASVLPIGPVRYAFVGAHFPERDYTLDFPGMGIMLRARDFADPAAARRRFLPRLREWGMQTDRPVGTVLLADSPGDVLEMVRAHPDADFLFPDAYRAPVAALVPATHDVLPASHGRFFLLAKVKRPRSQGRGCRM